MNVWTQFENERGWDETLTIQIQLTAKKKNRGEKEQYALTLLSKLFSSNGICNLFRNAM